MSETKKQTSSHSIRILNDMKHTRDPLASPKKFRFRTFDKKKGTVRNYFVVYHRIENHLWFASSIHRFETKQPNTIHNKPLLDPYAEQLKYYNIAKARFDKFPIILNLDPVKMGHNQEHISSSLYPGIVLEELFRMSNNGSKVQTFLQTLLKRHQTRCLANNKRLPMCHRLPARKIKPIKPSIQYQEQSDEYSYTNVKDW